jgi:sporulation protein YlmC with PRC-barrel domain
MKKASKSASKIYSNALVVAVCVLAGGWLAAQAQDASVGGINQPRQQAESTPANGQPTKMNKCSQLIGAAVENPQGDKLGKIDEVVVDLDNGRVSYCVLGVNEGLFSKPKYLAVPLSALRPSADGARLILSADKDKVAQAQGFDRDNWPSVTSPAWGAQSFWQTDPKPPISTPQDQNKNTPSGTGH